MKKSWGIVTLADAPADLLIAHAAWHLAAGAGEVHLYLDRDAPKARAVLAGDSRCRVTLADDIFWQDQATPRPRAHQRRQIFCASHASRTGGTDYLLHLDCDEFLWGAGVLDQELPALDPGAFLKIPNVERVWDPSGPGPSVFSPLFRAPEPGADRRGGLLEQGLTGHAQGKSASPRGYRYALGIHRPFYDLKREHLRPPEVRSHGALILHHDGMTPLDWLHKRLRKAHALAADPRHRVTPHMLAQIEALQRSPGMEAALALARDLQTADPVGRGRMVHAAPDPGSTVAALFPGTAVDLSAAAYDRWLWAERAALLSGGGGSVQIE